MKLNLSVTAAQLDTARSPIIGEDVVVSFAPENCQKRGFFRATGATTGAYTSAGGAPIPTAGRDIFARVASAKFSGVASSAMTLTLDVTLDDDTTGTATATFHIPTWSTAQANIFPIGVATDFTPVGAGNADKKIKAIIGFDACTNMVAGNKIEIFTSPNLADFVEIEGCRGKGGAFNLPKVIQIGAGRETVEWTKLGRGDSNPLKIECVNRGALEQLARFSGQQGTVLFSYIKDDSVLAQYTLFSGFWPQAAGEIPDTGETMITAEGPYERFAIGYLRVA